MAKPNRIQVEQGWITVGPRPGARILARFPEFGFTDVVSVLGTQEQAEELGESVQTLGLRWYWIPRPRGIFPTSPAKLAVYHETFSSLRARLAEGTTGVYFHCAAGMHRSPAVAVAFLYSLGWGHAAVTEALATFRPGIASSQSVGPDRLAWAQTFAPSRTAGGGPTEGNMAGTEERHSP